MSRGVGYTTLQLETEQFFNKMTFIASKKNPLIINLSGFIYSISINEAISSMLPVVIGKKSLL